MQRAKENRLPVFAKVGKAAHNAYLKNVDLLNSTNTSNLSLDYPLSALPLGSVRSERPLHFSLSKLLPYTPRI